MNIQVVYIFCIFLIIFLLKLKSNNKIRKLFSDGYNSFFHFLFGIMAIKFPYIIPLFISYQLFEDVLTMEEKNTSVDISEFFIGYSLASITLYNS